MLFLRWFTPTSLFLFLHPVTSSSSPTTPIHIKSSKFVHENGDQFFIKGIAYQRQIPGHEHEPFPEIQKGYIDLLAHPQKCLPDIELLKELNVNTIRVYQVDPDQNHDICMHALEKNGIYVLVELLEPKHLINRESPSWTTELLKHYQQVVDSMSKYENVLGFVAGNEVVTSVSDAGAAPFVKAAIRDTRAYQRKKGYRPIPIGYTANDDSETREKSLSYFQCGNVSADFYGINMFEWCGYSSFAASGLRARTAEFAALRVPVFLSEFGCNSVRPRPFTDTDALYGPEMAGVWLGGVAYEFFENENHYGVVHEAHGRVQKLAEFDTLRLRFAAARPRGGPVGASSGAKKPPTCPAWPALETLPPTPDPAICGCLQRAVTCVPKYGPGAYESDELSRENQQLLAEVCENTDCSAIESDGVRGVYGRFSGCAPVDRLAWALTALGSCESELAEKKEASDECGLDFWKELKKSSNSTESGTSQIVSPSHSLSLGSTPGFSQPKLQEESRANSTVGFHINGAKRVGLFEIGLPQVVLLCVCFASAVAYVAMELG